MTRRTFGVALAVIVFAALGIRVSYVLVVTRHHALTLDEIYYAAGADLLVNGDGFKAPPFWGERGEENADHPPLTTLSLAPVALIIPRRSETTALRLTMAAMGAGTVLIVGLLGRRVGGHAVGLIAAGLAAVSPSLIGNDGVIMSEGMAALLCAATILLVYRLLEQTRLRDALILGIAAGLAALSRGELALLGPIVIAPALLGVWRRAGWRRAVRLAGACVGATGMTVAPWIAFNLSRFDRPVLVSYGDGAVLAGANCQSTYDQSGPLIGSWNGYCSARRAGEPSVEAARERSQGLRFMKRHLGQLPLVLAAREGRIWSLYRVPDTIREAEAERRPWRLGVLGVVAWWAMVLSSLYGVALLRRRGAIVWPLLATLALVAVIAAAFYGLGRFRVPADVAITVPAAAGASALAKQVRQPLSSRPSPRRARAALPLA